MSGRRAKGRVDQHQTTTFRFLVDCDGRLVVDVHVRGVASAWQELTAEQSADIARKILRTQEKKGVAE